MRIVLVTIAATAARKQGVVTEETTVTEETIVITGTVTTVDVMAVGKDFPRMDVVKNVSRMENVPKHALTEATEEVQEMADLPFIKTDPENLEEVAMKVARVSALAAAAVKTAVVDLAVIAVMADLAAHREIDSGISSLQKDLQQKLRLRIWKRSVKKKRDASVRRKTSATARI